MDDVVTLRLAVPDDAPMLRRWDEEPHVSMSDPNDDWEWETELGRTPDWREFLVAEVAGRPIGFLQLIDAGREETHYWGAVPVGVRAIDIWIGPADALGKGYGTQMMELAMERCFRDPAATEIVIDPLASNVRAHRFYERLGFTPVGPRRFGADECLVYRLTRESWRGRRVPGGGIMKGQGGSHA